MVRPLAETDFVVTHLFDDEAGRQAAAEMDDVVHELPGLASLALFGRARDDVLTRRGSARPVNACQPLPADVQAARTRMHGMAAAR
jgi:hypothetical protein